MSLLYDGPLAFNTDGEASILRFGIRRLRAIVLPI
jgi:hypothetical protein